jgi:hypothetical protein
MSDRYNIPPLAGCERFLTADVGLRAMATALRVGAPAVIVADIFSWQRYLAASHLAEAPLIGMLPTPLLPTAGAAQTRDGCKVWIPSKAQLCGVGAG